MTISNIKTLKFMTFCFIVNLLLMLNNNNNNFHD